MYLISTGKAINYYTQHNFIINTIIARVNLFREEMYSNYLASKLV